ncbi:MAG: zinc ribbon domain-containing protein [Clostridia bacterium]|nr:zinc ribbon domain-containing protein [Clostridia bacterium]
MNCPKCGNPLIPNMKFCSKCGTPVPQQPPVMRNAPIAQPAQQNTEKPKEFLQYANPNVKQPQITPQNVVVQQPKKQKAEKKKKSKKNLPLIIIAVVLAIAVAVSGCIVGVDIFKNSKEKEGALYIDEFPVLKQKTEFTVYDAEKFPAEEYEIKVERMMLGGILKSEAFRGETVVEDTSTEHVYNIDFDKDGEYRITITDISPDNTQTTLTTTDSGDSDTTTITIIIDVKVDDDDPEALGSVDLNSQPGDLEEKDNMTADSDFVQATQADFDELIKFLNSNNFRYGYNYDSNTATTKDVIESCLSSALGIDGFLYFFGDDTKEYYENAEIYEGKETDPLGKFDSYGNYYYYYKLPVSDIKWVCEDIFNITFKPDYVSDDSYIYDDYCYRSYIEAGDGGIFYCELGEHSVSTDGKYEIIIKNYSKGFEETDIPILDHTKKLTAEIKIIDGERYWSIYKIEDYDPSTEPKQEESTVPSTAMAVTKLSADDIVSVYMKNKSVWCKDYGNFMHDGYSSFYVFVDLDFDGIPELLTTGVAGSGVYSSNKFYKLNSTKDGVEEITYTADSEEMYDFKASDEFPKLLKNKKNGDYVYWCHDVYSAGAAFGHGTTHGILEYAGGKVTQNDMFSTGIVREGGVENDYFNVITGSDYKKVSESEYNKSYDSFMSDYEKVNLKLKFISGNEFSGASEAQQKEYFKSSLKGFGFDGYVSQVQ